MNVSDLPAVPIHSTLLLFADDSKCSRNIQSTEDSQLLQRNLCRLYDWSHSFGLIFNSSKSCVLSYHSPRSDPVIFDYSIGDQIIDRHSICKDLGVLFSDSLTWSSQVELVLKKAYSTFRMIKRVFPGATTATNVKKKLYLSPVVIYGSPVWRPSLIRDIVSLEKLQRRATKYMLHDYQLDYKSRLCQLKLLPLMYQLEFIEVIFFITQLNCRSSSFNIPNYFSFRHLQHAVDLIRS